MKKFLLMALAFTIVSSAQTYQNPTYGNVTLKSNVEDNTATKVNVQTTDGKINWRSISSLPFIQSQNAIMQNGNFRISGTDSYFGTTKIFKSDTSDFPVNNKIPSGSFNINSQGNDDINLIASGTGQVNIMGGWGLGFKPVPGLSAGPDFGTSMGGMSYREPTESMTKNFLIFRFGQYVFEDDTATWKMILTPTGVNIGGGATGVGGPIPLNSFEVHGNAVIGGGYDRARTAPLNGLLVEGRTGIGTYNPVGKFNVLTGSGLTKDVINQENQSISFANGSSGVTVPEIIGKSTNGIGLAVTGVNIDSNPNADMVFNTTKSDGSNYTDLTKSAFRFRAVGSTTVNLIDILRNGNTTFLGTVSGAAPTSSSNLTTKNYVDTAVQTAARPYKVYTGLFNQTGTSAPTVTVLENTLGGTVTWSYTSTGDYLATLTGAFTASKTTAAINYGDSVGTVSGRIGASRASANTVRVWAVSNGVAADGTVLNGTIEIRVYP